MSSSNQVLARMSSRINQLTERFSEYLQYFDSEDTFIGPSIYFHHKTLALHSKYQDFQKLIESDEFYDWLYATLTAWGMHRMGQGKTRLRDIDDIKDSFRAQYDKLKPLISIKLGEIDKSDVSSISREIWNIISELRVSIAEARIVANSKALHHLLPNLVPPIDRSYTYRFFYDRNTLTLPEEEAFQEIFPYFARLARVNNELIHDWIGKGFHTSETKVIDNAIIGFVRKELKATEVE